MGRDDARAVPGLQGGTAPARAFAAFMKVAVANRPAEQFETQVTLPEFQLEPDQESYFGQPDNGLFVDENGNPVEPGTQPPVDQGDGQQVDADGQPIGGAPDEPRNPERLDQQWMDHVLGRDGPAPREAPAPGRAPPPRDRRESATPPPERPADRVQESRPTQ